MAVVVVGFGADQLIVCGQSVAFQLGVGHLMADTCDHMQVIGHIHAAHQVGGCDVFVDAVIGEGGLFFVVGCIAVKA